MENEPNGALVQASVVLPATTPELAKAAVDSFYKLRDHLLDDDDWQVINVKKKQPDGSYKWEKEKFPKKSGRCKLDLAFNVTQEFVQSTRQVLDDKNFGVLVVMKAIAPNGRAAIGDGWCDTIEKAGHKFHDIFTIAKTRASNRASFDLYGLGHVSAEEMTQSQREAADTTPTRPGTPVSATVETVDTGETVKRPQFLVEPWCEEHGVELVELEQFITGQAKYKKGKDEGKSYNWYELPLDLWENGFPSTEGLEDEEEVPFVVEPADEQDDLTEASPPEGDTINPGSPEMKKLRQRILIIYDDLEAAGDWLRLKHQTSLSTPIPRKQYDKIMADLSNLAGGGE